jgi:hypothetical protein
MTDEPTVTRPTAPEADLLDGAVASALRLDVTAVRRLLLAPGGGYGWPNFRVNEVELEWRRSRILAYLGLDEAVPGSVRLFDSLSVEAGVPPAHRAAAVEEGGGPLVAATYDELFPQGPLITRAVRERVVREPAPAETGEEHAARVAASARRRADYLGKLSSASYCWDIEDLLSARTAVDCAAEAVVLPPSAGAYFSGGPEPGWDVEHDALVSKSSNAYLGAGPTLVAVHEDRALVDLVSERMGRRMYPTRCTYLRYEEGDYLGVHTDQPTCEVSLLFVVDGEAGPLRSYLDETGHDPEWLGDWVRTHGHFPGGGLDCVYEDRKGFALTGRAVPHARLPQTEYALVGALFYSGLV